MHWRLDSNKTSRNSHCTSTAQYERSDKKNLLFLKTRSKMMNLNCDHGLLRLFFDLLKLSLPTILPISVFVHCETLSSPLYYRHLLALIVFFSFFVLGLMLQSFFKIELKFPCLWVVPTFQSCYYRKITSSTFLGLCIISHSLHYVNF